ncbi:tyrosine-type recombinase/integrase [Methylobacterium oryzihabitans]|uniref:Site-specific integrase n=1 Tax=Methylobacterium oryzihabitans TaxID=2499852 RepID=A0A437NYY9_9HYPH|nr:site-specific integrase [Methylobacterium oryzihabitans]RVU15197.1 site-specific integrase [Methylobacterium oryzihabitans]
MSVYRPKKAGKFTSEIYQYDFWCRGRRFHGSTGCRTKRDAERVAQRERDRARREVITLAEAKATPMTIDVAAARFWDERGTFYSSNARKTLDAAIVWIVTQLGRETLIKDIGNAEVAALVAQRRGETLKGRKDDTAPRLVSNATVNRTVIEPLRAILRRARDAWDQPIGAISWRSHALPVPRERVRELRDDEESQLLKALPAEFRTVVEFALISGCRLKECVGLRWSAVDWVNRTIEIHGKGGKIAKIPLSSEMRDLLFPLRGRHPEAVFAYTVSKARGHRRPGDVLPITYEGMKTVWRRALPKSKVANYRFHDNRHTAASRLLRAGGDLKVVQTLLRHEDITTTAKYAHVQDEDVRRAMEAASERRRQNAESQKSPEQPQVEEAKSLSRNAS